MNMSFAMTTQQVIDGTKRVTRRTGWANIKLGVIHDAIEKGQGLKKGEKVRVLRPFIPISSRWEPLWYMLEYPEYGKQEVILEGFPHLSPQEFVDMLCNKHKVDLSFFFNRIELTYPEER